MWVLLIPAAVIAAAWCYGASKVATQPPAKPAAPTGPSVPVVIIPSTPANPGTPAAIKVGDIVMGDFANATNVRFRVMQLTAADPNDIVVSREGDPSNTPIQMPKSSINQVIPS